MIGRRDRLLQSLVPLLRLRLCLASYQGGSVSPFAQLPFDLFRGVDKVGQNANMGYPVLSGILHPVYCDLDLVGRLAL